MEKSACVYKAKNLGSKSHTKEVQRLATARKLLQEKVEETGSFGEDRSLKVMADVLSECRSSKAKDSLKKYQDNVR